MRPAISDSVDLHKSSSLFKILDDYFLFHRDVLVFRKPTVSWLFIGLYFVSVFSLDIAIYVPKPRVRW